MDITKFFNVKSFMKRVLSSEPKKKNKKNERSRNESSTSNLEDVFAEGLKNPDCVLVSETFDLAKKSKGELALQEVTKTISFIGKTFDAYEQKERKMKKN